ncbi:thiamine pyrophosphate-binding protein [Streptosporangium sp. NPDC000396]|uniref:thiamine pyrophosphate-binding protein n=1 Tax=Streptosporangium sp. NPDC000396 TaxID=3366185 RepID=UPI0036946762
MARSGRHAVAEQLAMDGVRHVFGNPGTVEQGLLDALEEHPEIQYICTLQESIAVAMADGYARGARRPTVVQLHSGVGLGNGIGMMYQAMRGHSPLVVLAGDAGVRYDAMDAQMAADLVGMARPVTKWATRVTHPSSVLRVLRRAFKIAMTAPAGPVFVALPADVLDAANNEPVVPTSFPVTRSAPPKEEIDRAAALLAGADRPLIIAGDGVAFSSAQAELASVAEILGAPVWGADWAEVNLDQNHPQFRGMLGHMFGEHSKEITTQADAVLICGTYVFPEVFPSLDGVFASGAPVVHIDLDPYQIAKSFPVDVGLVADPAVTLAMLADALTAVTTPEGRARAAERVRVMAEEDAEKRGSELARDESLREAYPIHAARFADELARQLPADAVIFDEALTTSPDLMRYLPASRPGGYFQTRGGSLGVGIPGAIGLKLADPSATVVGFTGDGGAMYTIQALWTAARYDVDVTFVVCNNSSYELLKINIEEYWREQGIPAHGFPTSFDLSHPQLRFDGLAEAQTVPAARVERPEEIAPTIRKALSHPGPFLIDLVIASRVPDLRSVAGAAKA